MSWSIVEVAINSPFPSTVAHAEATARMTHTLHVLNRCCTSNAITLGGVGDHPTLWALCVASWLKHPNIWRPNYGICIQKQAHSPAFALNFVHNQGLCACSFT